jgi:hypothetical protein
MSWRTTVLFDNRSGKSLPSAGAGIGATVIRATRGTLEPTYFSIGETQKMVNIFGLPTKNNPELLEALEYNNSYPIWVSAPSTNGSKGAVSFGPSGSSSLGFGIRTAPTTLAAVEAIVPVALGDGVATSFGITIPGFANYVNQSIDVLVDGVSVNITATDADPEVLTGTDVSGTYDRTTGALDLTFVTEPAEGSVIQAVYTVDLSAEYGILLGKSDAAEYVAVQITEDAEIFSAKVFLKNTVGSWVEVDDSPIEFSLSETVEDGFGVNIFIDNAFKDHDFIVPITAGGADYSAFTADISPVGLTGGTRGDEVSGATLAVGYDQFQSIRKYSVDVFFDATADDSIPAKFSTLRSSYHKYSKFLLPTPMQSETDTIGWTLPVQDRGVAFFYGWFEMRNLYNNTGNIVSTPMGDVAKNVADIVVQAFGGLAPAWINENGMGGQLTSGRMVKSIYDPDESQLKLLDEARINPIVLDPNYGPMITSRRTSAAGLSDYSFIDYSGLIDYAVKNIVEQVLPYQIVKLNDDIHRNIVVNKTNSILQPMTVAPRNVIREYAIKCDGENNNDAVLAREEFRLDVFIKITPKSRTIVFTFVNQPQGVDISSNV